MYPSQTPEGSVIKPSADRLVTFMRPSFFGGGEAGASLTECAELSATIASEAIRFDLKRRNSLHHFNEPTSTRRGIKASEPKQ
jgi:hypothetical protein